MIYYRHHADAAARQRERMGFQPLSCQDRSDTAVLNALQQGDFHDQNLDATLGF